MSQTESRTPPTDDVTVLSRNTEFTGGKLKVAHDLTVRGVLEGEVRVGGKVVVAAGARVVGMLHAREAIIAGSVRGELSVSETLTLRSTSVVNGSAQAARLVVEEGSTGDVRLRVGDKAYFDLLESSRDASRAELNRVRARAALEPDGQAGRDSSKSRARTGESSEWSKDLAVTAPESSGEEGRSSDELLESSEMEEFLSGSSGPDGRSSASIEDRARAAD